MFYRFKCKCFVIFYETLFEFGKKYYDRKLMCTACYEFERDMLRFVKNNLECIIDVVLEDSELKIFIEKYGDSCVKCKSVSFEFCEINPIDTSFVITTFQ